MSDSDEGELEVLTLFHAALCCMISYVNSFIGIQPISKTDDESTRSAEAE